MMLMPPNSSSLLRYVFDLVSFLLWSSIPKNPCRANTHKRDVWFVIKYFLILFTQHIPIPNYFHVDLGRWLLRIGCEFLEVKFGKRSFSLKLTENLSNLANKQKNPEWVWLIQFAIHFDAFTVSQPICDFIVPLNIYAWYFFLRASWWFVCF